MILDGIKKFLSDNLNGKNAVIGLSGGIDSSFVVTLLAKSIEKDRIFPIYMPDSNSPDEDLIDVEKICNFNNISFKTISIESIVKEFSRTLNMDDLKAIGNLKSRIRMSILYSFANRNNGLVIGTTNRSEYLTGYFTKYGDGGCDIEPIIGMYKTEIWEASRALGLPQSIIVKKPSARLWAKQTDEDDLGISYADLDRILIEFVKIGKFPESREGKIVSNLYFSSMHKRMLPYSPGEEPTS